MRILINKKLITNKSLIDTITLKQEINKEAPDEDYYVLYQDDNKIGYILLDNDYLDALFVYPEYRGKGFGNILIQKAINLGVTWLSVDPKNKIAINLYKKYGFKIDSFNDKNGYDEYIMKRNNIEDSLVNDSKQDGLNIVDNVLIQADKDLKNVVIPNGVKSIGKEAFYNCSSLQSITIPNSVTSIGDWAFLRCSSLKSITIPDSVTSIGIDAFSYCKSLTSMVIPNSVTTVGFYIFHNCYNLKSVIISEGITSIESYAFSNCPHLTSISIPNSVTEIEKHAFDNCKSIIIHTNNEYVINYCKENNIKYDTNYIGDSMEKLKFNKWLKKEGNKLIINEGIERLGLATLNGYKAGIEEIYIPSTVKSIHGAAFNNMPGLKKIIISNDNPNKETLIERIKYLLSGEVGTLKNVNRNLVIDAKFRLNDVIKKENEGYVIYSKKGKKLSKPYKTKEEAEKRLKQIEYFKNTEDSMKLSKSVLEKQLKNVLRQYLLGEGYNDNDLEDYLVIDIKEIEDDGHKGIHVQIRNDLVGYYELPDEVASKLDKVVSQYDPNAYFEPYYSDTWDAYIWDQELTTDSFTPLYIYQFPKDLRDEDLKVLDKYHLEYIGHVSEEGNQPGDVLIKGTLDDLRDYCDSYLAYDLNDDYLYEVDEFDTDLITDSKHLEYEITKTPKGWYQVNFDGDVREFRTEKQAMEAIDEYIYPDIHKTRPELPENQRIETHRYIVGCINSADKTVEKMITATSEKQAMEKAKDKHDVVRVVYASLYDSKKIKDGKWIIIPNNDVYDCLDKYLGLEGIYGFTDEIIDVWNTKEAFIDDKLETFESPEEAIEAYLQWEGIKGYDEDIMSILRGEDGMSYDEYAEEDNETEIDDTFIKDEKVRTSRGEFDLVDMTDEQLKKEGYGMHHEENGIRVYTKNNQAVAIRVKDSKKKVKDSEKKLNIEGLTISDEGEIDDKCYVYSINKDIIIPETDEAYSYTTHIEIYIDLSHLDYYKDLDWDSNYDEPSNTPFTEYYINNYGEKKIKVSLIDEYDNDIEYTVEQAAELLNITTTQLNNIINTCKNEVEERFMDDHYDDIEKYFYERDAAYYDSAIKIKNSKKKVKDASSDLTNIKVLKKQDYKAFDEGGKKHTLYLVEYIPQGRLDKEDNTKLYAVIRDYNGEEIWTKGAIVGVSYKISLEDFNRQLELETKGRDAYLKGDSKKKVKDSEELQTLVKECKDIVEKSLGKDSFRVYHKMDGQQNKIVLQASLDYEDTDTEDELIDKLTKIIEDSYPNSEFKYHDKFAGGYWILKE